MLRQWTWPWWLTRSYLWLTRSLRKQIVPYPVGTHGWVQMGEDDDAPSIEVMDQDVGATYHPGVISNVRDYTMWCDTLRNDEPMYEVEITWHDPETGREWVNHGLINHCRFHTDERRVRWWDP